MDRWLNRVAVVTGASSGIGVAIVKDLVQSDFIVVGLGRRKELIDSLRSELPIGQQDRLYALRCDVTDLNSVNDAFDWIMENLNGIDVLVNNAGILLPGQLLTMDVAKIQQVIQTNVMGVVYCTQRAFQSMRERGFDGHIFNVNSVLGHGILQASNNKVYDLNIYPATKYAITAITEILRLELKALGTKIKITSISPGVTDTDILPESLKNMCKLQCKDISAGVLYALSTPPTVQVHELTIRPIGEEF